MSDLSQAKAVSLQNRVSPEEWAMRVDIAACYRLVALFGGRSVVAGALHLVAARSSEDRKHVKEFMDWLRAEARSDDGDVWNLASTATRPATRLRASRNPRSRIGFS